MKKFVVITVVLVIGISLTYMSCGTFMKGNGTIISSERIVSSFEKIHSSGSAEVLFHKSNEYRVVITTDSNLIEIVTTEIRNNTLNIGTENGSYSFTKLMVDVYCPVLAGVTISGSGNFFSNDRITVSTFESDVSGSGNIEGTIECERFIGKITGSGRITVSGNVKDSSIIISGSGDFSGNDFAINNADVRISGSGDANIYVTDDLKINISGSGMMTYRGDPPKVDSSISGSGKIRKL